MKLIGFGDGSFWHDFVKSAKSPSVANRKVALHYMADFIDRDVLLHALALTFVHQL